MSDEAWRPSPVRPDRYRVSDRGRVRSSWAGGRILHPKRHPSGHLLVSIYVDGRQRNYYVHRLVAEAFCVAGEGPAVRHLDGDPTNNRATNLRYGTLSENMADTLAHGTHNMARRTECENGHPYVEGSFWYYKRERVCKACQSERTRRYKQRKAVAA